VRQWGTDDVRAKGGDYFQAQIFPPEDMMTNPVDHPRDGQGPGRSALTAGGLSALMESANGALIRVRGVADAPGEPGGHLRQGGRPCPR